jgi:hypothetical protein
MRAVVRIQLRDHSRGQYYNCNCFNKPSPVNNQVLLIALKHSPDIEQVIRNSGEPEIDVKSNSHSAEPILEVFAQLGYILKPGR